MKGLGNDIIEISRIEKAYKEHGQTFLDRLFTKKEQDYCLAQSDPHPRIAGRFTGKEAIAKALGCGFGDKLSWQEVEILPDQEGRPIVHISGEAWQEFSDPKLLISISHCEKFAIATAIWLK